MRLTDTAQYAQGKIVEAYLDIWFGYHGWDIKQTTDHEERVLCIGDRHFSKGQEAYKIEYKSGLQTYITGNIFLETVSVDTDNKKGWVYTSHATFIFYACLFNHKLLIFRPETLRAKIDFLKTKFPEKPTGKGQNEGYQTWGVCVPLKYAIEHIADKVNDL